VALICCLSGELLEGEFPSEIAGGNASGGMVGAAEAFDPNVRMEDVWLIVRFNGRRRNAEYPEDAGDCTVLLRQ
jgi:hypothetical protein